MLNNNPLPGYNSSEISAILKYPAFLRLKFRRLRNNIYSPSSSKQQGTILSSPKKYRGYYDLKKGKIQQLSELLHQYKRLLLIS